MSRLTFQEPSRLQARQQIQRHWLERCRPKGDPMAEFLLVLGIEDLEQGSCADQDAPRLWRGRLARADSAFEMVEDFSIHSPRQGKT
jgi:hypothetical protein